MAYADCVLLDEHDVANRLKISVKTLRNKRVSDPGFLPFCKLGRSVRYRHADVEALVEASLRKSTSDQGGGNVR
jgi:hypothetical protein